jgi:predicted transcriptional regulator
METSAYGVPVVDEEGRLVGILPRATTALGLLKNAGDAAAEHVTIDWSTVDESLSLSGAFELMVTRRARELSVVGTGRTVVGTLRDIDALRFVAHVSRTGMRPPLERAA